MKKRILSILFIFLMISSIFAILPAMAHAANPENYEIKIYDSQGRYLDTTNYYVQKYAYIKVYEGWIFPQLHLKKIAEHVGGWCGFKTSASKVYVEFYWIGTRAYTQWISTDTYQFDNEGNKVITVDLPFTPAIPISAIKSEPISVSGDMHEISTAYYDVQFGTGTYKHQIQLKIGDKNYVMPVYLQFHGGGSTETKPFKFLAQTTKGYVQGEDKFLIWTTAEYWSAVRSTKVGDNMLLVVWTYGYTNVAGAWISKVISAAIAGAILGATTGPEGALMGGVIGGWASAIAWAVDPHLVNLKANTGIGVVAALFTPRWFMIQGVGGLGANGTSATIEIDNIPQSTRSSYQSLSYEIHSESNSIQVGFTKDYGNVKTYYYDFEDGKIPSNFKVGDSNTKIVSAETPSYVGQTYYTNGMYALQLKTYASIDLGGYQAGQYKISYSLYIGMMSPTNNYMYVKTMDDEGTLYSSDKYSGSGTSNMIYHAGEVLITLTSPRHIIINLTFEENSANTYGPVIDDISIQVQDTGSYRYIFETGSSSDSAIVRHMFGTIPTIAPANTGTPIKTRYTLLAVDMAHRDGMLAVDWQSRMVTISPARIMVKTDTWQETAWLLGTDDKDGFKNVTFVVTDPNRFIYRVDFMSYYYFTTPKNWTVSTNWNPFIANNTTIYVPDLGGINLQLEQLKWNLDKWWQEIGTWGHLALYGLGLFIIFLIILIVAPWLIFAIFKILAMIIKALFIAIGMAAKGAGKLLGKRRRKK